MMGSSMVDVLEAKCTNKECSAYNVWVLDVESDGLCATCSKPLSEVSTAPQQKQADPDEIPDFTGIDKGL